MAIGLGALAALFSTLEGCLRMEVYSWNPCNISVTQLTLGIKVSKGLMVRVKDKLLC